MSYAQVVRALYDYQATADDELTIAEDEGLYVLDNTDPEWWKVKRRAPADAAGHPQAFAPGRTAEDAGLVPATYVEDADPVRVSRALYDYTASAEEELSMREEDLLDVYEYDGEWLLVKKHDDRTGRVGFVPANYVDETDAQGQMAAHGGPLSHAHAQDSYVGPEAPPAPPPPPPPPAPAAVPVPAPAHPAAVSSSSLHVPPPLHQGSDEDDDDAEMETGRISQPSVPAGLSPTTEDTIKMWSVSVRS